MEITPIETGPVALLHVGVGFPGAVSAKLITPAGAAAFTLPVTVAVKVMEPPRVGVELLVNTTVGVAEAMRVEEDVTAPTALYPLSPEKVKLAL